MLAAGGCRARLAEDLFAPQYDPDGQQHQGEDAHADGQVDQCQAGSEYPRDQHGYRPGHEDSAEPDH
jgi:hypothetical protein